MIKAIGIKRNLNLYCFLLTAFVGLFCSSAANAVTKPNIYHLDLRNTTSMPDEKRYDIIHASTCIQGLANRQAPRVFITFHDKDPLWLDRLRETNGLCEGWSVREIKSFEEYLRLFKKYVNGVVLYDPDPDTGAISTNLVATTVAGVEGGIAVRKDESTGSMYNYLVNNPQGPKLPVIVDLAGKFTGSGTIWQTSSPSTGSAKCDAYIWAIEKYIDTGKCDPTTLMYSLDLWGLKVKPKHPDRPKNWQMLLLANLDYAITRKGFCFELSPWGDEAPNDDPTQPLGSDLETYKKILHACNLQTNQKEAIKSCGFLNIDFKYTSIVGSKHDPVPTEWEREWLQTAYNTYSETDAPPLSYFSNSSFYTGLMPILRSRRYIQNPPPSYEEMVSRGLIDSKGDVAAGNYILLGMQDYDQCSWTLYLLAGDRYDDPARGQSCLNWMVAPNAVDRVSVALDYMQRHKSDKDYFCGGDAGAGYINPTQLRGLREPSGYPSGVSVWQKHCRKYYRMFDYSITGWLLDGKSGLNTRLFYLLGNEDLDTYIPFSGDGIGVGYYTTYISQTLHNNCPAIKRSWPDDPRAEHIINYSAGVHFAWYRTILRYPRDIKALQDKCLSAEDNNNRHFLDMYSFYYLLRHNFGGKNNYRAAWVSDNIPRIMAAGQTYPVTVSVRNDGWDTWTGSFGYSLGHAVISPKKELLDDDYLPQRTPIPEDITVKPGETVTFSFKITAPKTLGNFDLYYDMFKNDIGSFREQNNIEWKKEIIIASNQKDVDTDEDGVPDVVEDVRGTLYWHPDDGR
jgi:hypothetical protein